MNIWNIIGFVDNNRETNKSDIVQVSAQFVQCERGSIVTLCATSQDSMV